MEKEAITRKRELGGSICGGVISQTMNMKHIKKYGIWADMMSYVMPDKQYKKWAECKKLGDERIAKKIFEKYAYSQI